LAKITLLSFGRIYSQGKAVKPYKQNNPPRREEVFGADRPLRTSVYRLRGGGFAN
jgi:hypothetical protein